MRINYLGERQNILNKHFFKINLSNFSEIEKTHSLESSLRAEFSADKTTIVIIRVK